MTVYEATFVPDSRACPALTDPLRDKVVDTELVRASIVIEPVPVAGFSTDPKLRDASPEREQVGEGAASVRFAEIFVDCPSTGMTQTRQKSRRERIDFMGFVEVVVIEILLDTSRASC